MFIDAARCRTRAPRPRRHVSPGSMSAWRLACVAIALSCSAFGADGVVRFRVEYRAPPECPDARAFVAGVTGRTKHAMIAPGPDARAVEVVIESAPALEGRVRIAGPRGELAERSVRGAACREVVDALALITALSFDPEASSEVTRDPVPEPAAPPPVAAGPRAPSLVWSLYAGLTLVPFESALPGSDLGFGAAVGASSEGAILAPLTLLMVRRTTGDVARVGGRAELGVTSAGLVGCPVRIPAQGSLALRPCAGFELGRLDAEGVNLTQGRRHSSVWLLPTVGARGQWQFSAPFVASAELGAGFPLKRQHYTFDSGERVHDIPRVSLGAALELGVELR